MNDYLYVKNWTELQHYSKRNPPWIKLYRRLLKESDFLRLSEFEQWQLVRMWLLSAEDHPGGWLENDESLIRRGIGSMKPVPIRRFIDQGWLLPRTAEEFASASASGPASKDPPMLPLREAEKTESPEKIVLQIAGGKGDPVKRLVAGLKDSQRDTEGTIRGMVRKYRLSEGDIAWALECATGPGVRSPLRVAISELRKRGEQRAQRVPA